MLLGCTVSYGLLSFDSPLRSGLSLHIEERKKYRFMTILDLPTLALWCRWACTFHVLALSLFPFQLPTAAATARSSDSCRTIHLSTYFLSHFIPCTTIFPNGELTAPSASEPFLKCLSKAGYEPKVNDTARNSVGEGQGGCNGVHGYLWSLVATKSRTHQFV